jgi:hypothetical protein
MATRLKTVEFAFPTLTTMANNTPTTFTQTVYIPEATKTFRAVWVEVSMDDITTTTASTITTKSVNLQLGAVAYSLTTNANTYTSSAKNLSLFLTRGGVTTAGPTFADYFNTNWTSTSMTCNVQVQVNQSAGTTSGMTNICVTLHITYAYDDTATTQIKTVYIPLNAPVTTLPTAKTSHDTIPLLDTYLPEASKTYRDIHITTQSNTNAVNTTAHTVSYQLDSLTATTTQSYAATLNVDRWCRYVYGVTALMPTNATHTFNVWLSIGLGHHSMQAWMVVTYEFNASTTTSVMNSLLVPMEIPSPVGTSSTIWQRATRELMVQEPSPVLTKLAAFVRWNNTGDETGLNARIGTGSFVAYTNTGSGFIQGGKGMMIRNDAPTGITFGRGRNTLQLDIYNTSTTAKGGNYGALWMVNYTSGVNPGNGGSDPGGVGSHNHSIIWPLAFHGTGVASLNYTTAAVAPIIPEANFYVTALCLRLGFVNNGVNVVSVPTITVERTAGEGGLLWEEAYADAGMLMPRTGYNETWSQIKDLFQRWPNDADSTRVNVLSGRRWNLYLPNQTAAATAAFWETFQLYMTYHSIAQGVSGNVTGSAGGTVNIALHRTGTGERVLNTSRVGNGAYSFSWYDDTEQLFTVVKEDSSHLGLSSDSLAA